ncbi:hypothetical protein [Nitrospirillum amazonense]|nr:hypothetical protein [Nitrospirillum amazonense]
MLRIDGPGAGDRLDRPHPRRGGRADAGAMPIDIGLFSTDPGASTFGDHDVIHLAKHPLHFGEQTIELVVNKKPAFVGIDPYNKLIDRNSDDNVARLGQ